MHFLEKALPYSLSSVSLIISFSVVKCSLGVIFSLSISLNEKDCWMPVVTNSVPKLAQTTKSLKVVIQEPQLEKKYYSTSTDILQSKDCS